MGDDAEHLTFTVAPTDAGVDSSDLEKLVLELKSEFNAAPTAGFQINETQGKNEGTLGPEWLPILTAVVSSQLALEVTKGLISIVRDWLSHRKPVVVTIKGPKGEYKLTGEALTSGEIEKIAERVVHK
jgi:Effector Associated Constant Component 1